MIFHVVNSSTLYNQSSKDIEKNDKNFNNKEDILEYDSSDDSDIESIIEEERTNEVSHIHYFYSCIGIIFFGGLILVVIEST